MESYLALAHPDAPPLPWCTADGREVCSFSVIPLEAAGGILALCYDAHGNEVEPVGDYRAIEATAVALGGQADELTFLPAAIS
jgi:hypothetical protein